MLNSRYVFFRSLVVLNRSTDWVGRVVQAVCVEAGMIALREGFTEIGHEHYLSGILCVHFYSAVLERALNRIDVHSEVQSKKKNDHVSWSV